MSYAFFIWTEPKPKLRKRESSKRGNSNKATNKATSEAESVSNTSSTQQEQGTAIEPILPAAIPGAAPLYGFLVVPNNENLCLRIEGKVGFGQPAEVQRIFEKNDKALQTWGACGPEVAGRLIIKGNQANGDCTGTHD